VVVEDAWGRGGALDDVHDLRGDDEGDQGEEDDGDEMVFHGEDLRLERMIGGVVVFH
jgi:hypothetical protein